MFRLLLQPSSGLCYYFFILLIISPWKWQYYRAKHVGENIVGKIHNKQWNAFCWLFINYWIARLLFCLATGKFPCAQILWFEYRGYVRQQLSARTFFLPPSTLNIWKADLVWQADTWNIPWQYFPAICHREQKSCPGLLSGKSPASVHSRWENVWPFSGVIIFVA